MRRACPLLLLFLCAVTYAQKARPVEIPLREGAGYVQGRLKGRQQMEYEVEATGKTLTVSLSCAPVRTLAVRVYDPDGEQRPLQREAPARWTVTLPQEGRYGI